MNDEAETLTFASCGREVAGYLYRPSVERRSAVVFSHGLTNSHSDAPVFDDLRSALLSAGYPVFMFDYLGSGNSDGSFEDKTWLNQRQCLQDALSFASTMGFEHPGQYLFGRSVGGALSGFFLNQTSVKGAVLASPPLHLEAAFGKFRARAVDGYVRMPDNLERSGQIRGEWKLPIAFFDQLSDVENELISAVAGAKNTLLLQASDDAKVGLSHTSAFYDLLSSPKRLEIIEGADHYYAGRETEVVEATLNWFDQIGGTA